MTSNCGISVVPMSVGVTALMPNGAASLLANAIGLVPLIWKVENSAEQSTRSALFDRPTILISWLTAPMLRTIRST